MIGPSDNSADQVGNLREPGRYQPHAEVTIRQLLTMTSGVGWREDYHDPASPASRLLRRYHQRAGGMRAALCEIPAGDPPGSRYAYCTPDSLVLDWVRERATGQPFA